MSFQIILQRTLSEPIKVIKDVNNVLETTGVLREGCSIVNPVVLIEGYEMSVLNSVNYFSIPEFGRKYFLGDIVSVRNGLLQISGHTDVISSFSGDLLLNKGIIHRQENDWNLYLNDGVLKIYQNPIVRTAKFPTGFTGQGNASYVLALAGRRGVISAIGSHGTTVIPGPGITPGAGGGEVDGSGNGSKSCSGLADYALAHMGDPYWWGTFGNTANQALLSSKLAQYPDWYNAKIAAGRDFTQDFGRQVFDCVGLIKGYRWSATAYSAPVYVASQDVAVAGLFGQCSITKGAIGDHYWNTTFGAYRGICLFDPTLGHTGVSMGDGTVIHCTTGSYNSVIRTNISGTGWNWAYWGMPDWMLDNVGVPFD